MNRMVRYALSLFSVALITACGGGVKTPTDNALQHDEVTSKDSVVAITPEYAKGFSVTTLEDGTRLVDVHDPQKDSRKAKTYKYALIKRGTNSNVPQDYTTIEVPIRSTICMTALQLSNFTALDAHDVVRGITGTKNLYNADILERVEDGRIVKIGMEGNFDAEVVLAANPDVIFISPFKRGGYEVIKETGITLVQHLGYKELNPLGQAEWIKFIAMFIGKEQEANTLFDSIAYRYNKVKEQAAAATHHPIVFSGEMHGGNWYAVGGRSYLAQLFRDAGADYILHDENTGGVNIEFEKMYALAANADYWRILNSFHGEFCYAALKASEPRNADFKAFQERRVIYCNMRTTPYYEITPVTPDIVLSDLVAIFHPNLMGQDYKPTFYHLLDK